MGQSVAEQYLRQDRWRRWDDALALVPLKAGDRVLDLGCGVGQVTARLSQRGAEVVGLDRNEELLAAARATHPDLRFETADLRDLDCDRRGPVDGLWASFVTAYFPDLRPALARWSRCIRPGGWMALVEVDDLLGHEPLPPPLRTDVVRFYEEARDAGRYDFEGGRQLGPAAREVGLEVLHDGVLPDNELAFVGPAVPDVLDAWRERLHRMGGLKAFMGDGFDEFQTLFLSALACGEHWSLARVCFVVARKPDNSGR